MAQMHADEYEEEGLSRLGFWIAVVLVILLLSLGGAGYYLFQMLRAEQAGLGGQVGKESQRLIDLTHQITALQKEVATLHAQVARLEGAEGTRQQQWQAMLSDQSRVFDEKLAALSKQLELSHAQLKTHLDSLQQQLNRTKSAVMIADAEYLLNVANQKLRLVGDTNSALKAMETADELLRLAGDPALFRVREVLAREIAALKAIESPDVVGISAQILALEEQIKSLPLRLPHMGRVAPKPGEEDKGLLKDWKEVLTIRRRQTDRPVEAILTPEEVEAIRHALVLKLETARLAAVRGEPLLYRTSLEAAEKWVNEHFDTQAQSVAEFTAQLQAVSKRPVAVEISEVGQALQLLRNLPQLRLELDRLSSLGSPQTEGLLQGPQTPSQ
ncbi:MAG: uroporphyrinogen-III C-methyltransferase [Methylohalobius sp.]